MNGHLHSICQGDVQTHEMDYAITYPAFANLHLHGSLLLAGEGAAKRACLTGIKSLLLSCLIDGDALLLLLLPLLVVDDL